MSSSAKFFKTGCLAAEKKAILRELVFWDFTPRYSLRVTTEIQCKLIQNLHLRAFRGNFSIFQWQVMNVDFFRSWSPHWREERKEIFPDRKKWNVKAPLENFISNMN